VVRRRLRAPTRRLPSRTNSNGGIHHIFGSNQVVARTSFVSGEKCEFRSWTQLRTSLRPRVQSNERQKRAERGYVAQESSQMVDETFDTHHRDATAVRDVQEAQTTSPTAVVGGFLARHVMWRMVSSGAVGLSMLQFIMAFSSKMRLASLVDQPGRLTHSLKIERTFSMANNNIRAHLIS